MLERIHIAMFIILLGSVSQGAEPKVEKKKASAGGESWAAWAEPDFPFYSTSLDLRKFDPGSKPLNITPRGLVLNLGGGMRACLDTELLRIAAIWRGPGVSPVSLAPLSYQNGDTKTPGGQNPLPEPIGDVWLINGMYPGWQSGAKVTTDDPRPAEPSIEEPGRGPLPETAGRFGAIRLAGDQVALEYTAAGSKVQEWITADMQGDSPRVRRTFRLDPCSRARWIVLGAKGRGAKDICFTLAGAAGSGIELTSEDKTWSARVPASDKPRQFAVHIARGPQISTAQIGEVAFVDASQPARARWPREVATNAKLSPAKDAYVVDDIALPRENPWRRNVRLADLEFFKNGDAAGVTLDGDVWLARGLAVEQGPARWRRFASGLHEPMGLVIRQEQIFVFDRNGIWRLIDSNGDGEADVHELFYNHFTQSAESREFPNSIKLAPDGSMVISKGGQQASTISRLNGSVLRIAADGKSHAVLGVGFRQPFVGVNPRTGLVTASDQEGQYIPSTPLHIVKDGAFHGYLSELLPREKYPAPIAQPLTWIPHSVNPSATTQVWLHGAKMGPLNDSMIHLGFNRPEIFRVIFNERGSRPQAAVVSVVRDYDVPTLNGAVNPADGFLYVTGFQVVGWGTTAKRLSGLARIRHTDAPCTLPKEVAAMDKGLLLRFDVKLDPRTALDLANYSIESWHYQRTYKYGSPHLKSDDSLGQDWITPSSAYLSSDGRSVFLGIPNLKPVMQMRLGWAITSDTGLPVAQNAYFTPYELTPFDPAAEGFGSIQVDLTPRKISAPISAPASVAEGRRLYQLMGCMACHAIEPTDQPKIGPSWSGLYGKERDLAKPKSKIAANEDYLRESILNPPAKVVKGFEKLESGMPVYAGVLNDSQIESLILFIKSLH